jgi:DNA-binding NarL/FixJ family response regulator
VRIVVADDHPIVREGLRAVLGTARDLELVGEAADGRQAVSVVEAARPDVLLLDLDLPEIDGLDVLRILRARGLRPAVLLFTAYDSDPRLVRALREGARGCVLKGAPREELFAAIRAATAGSRVLPPGFGERILAGLQGEGAAALTPRQSEVLALLADGRTNQEIALALGIGVRTVKYHVEGLLRRLGARNRTEAVGAALANGWIPRR